MKTQSPDYLEFINQTTTFATKYQVLPQNAGVASIKNTVAPENKGGSLFGISLSVENIGSANIGKDHTFSLVAGKASPGSFNLPLIKPQGATRTISISIDLASATYPTFWAVKDATGAYSGTIIEVTFSKTANTASIRCLDLSEAIKQFETIKNHILN